MLLCVRSVASVAFVVALKKRIVPNYRMAQANHIALAPRPVRASGTPYLWITSLALTYTFCIIANRTVCCLKINSCKGGNHFEDYRSFSFGEHLTSPIYKEWTLPRHLHVDTQSYVLVDEQVKYKLASH